jgi:hypothetical protein
MEDESEEPRPAKRQRIPKACKKCRESKLKCDEKRPCSRCAIAHIECVYAERPLRDSERIEKLEQEIVRLNQRLSVAEHVSPSASYSVDSIGGTSHPSAYAPWDSGTHVEPLAVTVHRSSDQTSRIEDGRHEGLIGFTLRSTTTTDVVSSGIVSEADAFTWFTTFFEGCVWYVPIFDLRTDTYVSIRSRSSILFNTIVIIGARAAQGALTRGYQTLHHVFRQHASDLVLRLSAADARVAVEDIQALLVIASYSDSGPVLCDVAVRACLRIDLPAQVNESLTSVAQQQSFERPHTIELTDSVRIWYYLYVLDMILSIDGGKPSSITIPPSSARRVRLLLSRATCIPTDVRLFAQVELNAVRSSAHLSISSASTVLQQNDSSIHEALHGAILDLDLWMSDWQTLITGLRLTESEHSNVLLNLRVQHAWALLVLHLRALTVAGIDNIALMTDEQRRIALAAKVAAERHLGLVMTDVSDGRTPSTKPYVSNFRYAMEFVWAKNAFCVLIVLRMNMILGNVNELWAKLQDAKAFLFELNNVGMGANISYIRILTQIVEKCEKALRSGLDNGTGNGASAESNDNDFESFAPKEFMFEWDFPGVQLHYIPLQWQDLLFDIGITT